MAPLSGLAVAVEVRFALDSPLEEAGFELVRWTPFVRQSEPLVKV